MEVGRCDLKGNPNFALSVYSVEYTDVHRWEISLIARFMGSTGGPPGADRIQVGPMLATWTLLSGFCFGHEMGTYVIYDLYVPLNVTCFAYWYRGGVGVGVNYHIQDWSSSLWFTLTLQSPYTDRNTLTHWGRDKMAAISQTTFSNAFSWMKMYEFRLRFHWSLFLVVQTTISQHWFR